MDQTNKAIEKRILDTSKGWSVPHKNTDADSWAAIEQQISETKTISISRRGWLKWAASIALIASLTLWWSNRTGDLTYTADQFTEVTLPDGSTVSLDIGTKLKYDEQNGQRMVELEGLAYFDVVKGKPFSIITKNGKVGVLGTSFNVNSFGKELKVECFTGKVMVEANESVAVLTPGAMIKTVDGQLTSIESFDIENGMSWLNGEFNYKNALIEEVLTEVERQYSVEILLNIADKNRSYSGLFNKEDDLDTVLKSITMPLGLTYQRTSNNQYQVID